MCNRQELAGADALLLRPRPASATRLHALRLEGYRGGLEARCDRGDLARSASSLVATAADKGGNNILKIEKKK